MVINHVSFSCDDPPSTSGDCLGVAASQDAIVANEVLFSDSGS